MEIKTATFIGHRECFDLKEEVLINPIENLIKNGCEEFLCGGMGQFDWMCARTVYNFKNKYLHIKLYLIIPYLSFAIQEKSYFDEIIFPEELENLHFKSAIPARNKYLVSHADVAICYVSHNWGGAAKTYSLAAKKGITIINLADA